MGRRLIRRLLAAAAILIIAVVLAGLFFLRTEAGLRAAISLGTSLAASDDLAVEIGGVEGTLVSPLSLSDIRISDSRGPWLALDRLTLDWKPSALLRGILSVNTLDIGTVEAMRAPVPAAPAPPPASGGFEMPFGVSVSSLTVGNIALAAPVMGVPAAFSVNGSARLVDVREGLNLSLEASRTDGMPGDASAEIRYRPGDGAIRASISAQEPQGGVVARLLDLPGHPPLELTVTGAGTLNAGRIILTLTAAREGRLDAVANLARDNGGIRVDLKSGGNLQRIVPPAYTRLVEGETRLDAVAIIASDRSQVTLDSLSLASAGLGLGAKGVVDLRGKGTDLTFRIDLGPPARFKDLGLPDGVVWDSASASGRITGALDAPEIEAEAEGRNWRAQGHLVGDIAADLDIAVVKGGQSVRGRAVLGGLQLAVPHDVAAAIGDRATLNLTALRRADGAMRVDSLDLTGADAHLTYSGTVSPRALDGTLTLATSRLDLTSDLAVAQLDTSPAGNISLRGTADGTPVSGETRFERVPGGVRLEELLLSTGSVNVAGRLLVDPAQPSGEVNITVGDLADLSPFVPVELVGALDGMVTLDARALRFQTRARSVAVGASRIGSAVMSGMIEQPFGARRIRAQVDAQNIDAGTAIPSVRLGLDGPLNAVAVTLDAAIMDGTVTAGGTLDAADATAFRLDRLDAELSGIRTALDEPVDLRLDNGAVAFEKLALRAGEGRITASGRAGAELALDIDVAGLPLSLANGFSPGLGLQGALTGSAHLAGPAATPSGDYRIDAQGISVPATRELGLGGYTLRGGGTLAPGRATVDATLSGSGTDVKLTGSLPLGDGALDMSARGTLDAALLNARLAASGDRLLGTVNIDVTAEGTLKAPVIGGTARLSGGRFTSVNLGLDLTGMSATVTGQGQQVTLSAFSATTPGGGSLSGSGQVSVDPAAGFPGTVRLTAQGAQIARPPTVSGTADADITVEGALARNPRVAGSITLRRMEITVPERIPASIAAIDVRHINTPPAVARQLPRKAAADDPAGQAAFDATLDLTVRAANQVFVRGQGIEAELGGDLRVRGTSANPVIDGGFTMRRGTFAILGQRLTFTRGIATFSGDVVPDLDLVAETATGGVTAYVEVTGRASMPQIVLSSSPSLPSDEVLSRLLFNRATGDLSPGQAVQLAQALASLAGGGPGALDQVRRGLGLDALDITTDAAGAPALGVERYINDRISLGVSQGVTPDSSRVKVDIGITDHIKAEASVGADGSSRAGVTVEWEY